MIDISPYKFKRLNHTADFVHVCPCPDTYRGLHSGKDNALMGERYTEEVKKIITEATNKGRKVELPVDKLTANLLRMNMFLTQEIILEL